MLRKIIWKDVDDYSLKCTLNYDAYEIIYLLKVIVYMIIFQIRLW